MAAQSGSERHQSGLLRRRQTRNHAAVRSHPERRGRQRADGYFPRLYHSPRMGTDVPQLRRQRSRTGIREPDFPTTFLR